MVAAVIIAVAVMYVASGAGLGLHRRASDHQDAGAGVPGADRRGAGRRWLRLPHPARLHLLRRWRSQAWSKPFNVMARPQAPPPSSNEGMTMPVLLITGAGRGIGAATAKLAAARGYDVGVNYKTDAKSAADVVAAVTAQGRKRRRDPGRHGARGRRRAHVQGGRRARAAHAFRLQRRHPRPLGTAGERGLRDDARGDRGQRAGRAVVDAARHPPHVEEARRGGRLDRAAVVGRGRHRRTRTNMSGTPPPRARSSRSPTA